MTAVQLYILIDIEPFHIAGITSGFEMDIFQYVAGVIVKIVCGSFNPRIIRVSGIVHIAGINLNAFIIEKKFNLFNCE